MYHIKYFIKWFIWICKGKPHILYEGYHCGTCGRWIKEDFRLPTFKSTGDPKWDRLGICDDCNRMGKAGPWNDTVRSEGYYDGRKGCKDESFRIRLTPQQREAYDEGYSKGEENG